jgi:two-component system, chemotaxis family, sensor kinase CheA
VSELLQEKAREEFFSEAQEIVETLSRDIVTYDDLARGDRTDPSILNDIFRGVHTLKGLAGLFGANRMAALSHELEGLLDELRLGKKDVSRDVIDLLFRAVEAFGQLLALERENSAELPDNIEGFFQDLARVVAGGGNGNEAKAPLEVDPALLAVLTEYEEHRLRASVQSGAKLYRARANFRLATIDEEIEELKVRAKPFGEIITYLPTGDGGDIDSIELEIILASSAPVEELRTALGESVQLDTIEGPKTTAPAKTHNTVAPESGPVDHSEPPAADSSRDLRPKSVDSGELLTGRGPATPVSLRSVSQSVRVDIRKLDHLMTLVGELTIVRSSLGKIVERVGTMPGAKGLATELERLSRGFGRHLEQMQDGILEVRMVAIGQIFEKLGRVVRQASREAEKQVNLVITGAETEVDKLIVEELSDPLMHMVRNAIDHGIEHRDDRLAVGKPESGTIAINAFQKGSHVLIEIEDDGRGMDSARLAAVAVDRGFLTEAAARELSRGELLQLIFLPGFTTKATADLLAGRGVGMDVVKTNVSRLGGIIDVSSEVGIGTKMTVTLPITLAILSVLIVHVDNQPFAVPLASIQEALSFDPSLLRIVEGREVMTLRGASLPLARLGRIFDLDDGNYRGRSFVVVVAVGQRRLGLVVDHLEGQQDIVIKPLGPSLASVKGFAGAAELGDQRVGLVIDVPARIEEQSLHADATRGLVHRRKELPL